LRVFLPPPPSPITPQGVPRAELDQHVDERLRLTQLLDVGDAYVSSFSGGMKRRLSVACAAIGDPRIIFLDEPTTGEFPVWYTVAAIAAAC